MDHNKNFQKYDSKDEELDLSFDKNFEKYVSPEKDKSDKIEPSKLHFEKSHCGKINIKCENVYINIVCSKEKKCDH